MLPAWRTVPSVEISRGLDPPTFTRTKQNVNDALRGYKEIHLRALKLLRPGETTFILPEAPKDGAKSAADSQTGAGKP